jgi:hypothetical protein
MRCLPAGRSQALRLSRFVARWCIARVGAAPIPCHVLLRFRSAAGRHRNFARLFDPVAVSEDHLLVEFGGCLYGLYDFGRALYDTRRDERCAGGPPDSIGQVLCPPLALDARSDRRVPDPVLGLPGPTWRPASTARTRRVQIRTRLRPWVPGSPANRGWKDPVTGAILFQGDRSTMVSAETFLETIA